MAHDHVHPDAIDWKTNGVKVIPGNALDPNTAQTPGMFRAAAVNHARAGAEKLWAGTVTIHPFPTAPTAPPSPTLKSPPVTDDGPPTISQGTRHQDTKTPGRCVTKLHKTNFILSLAPNKNSELSRRAPQTAQTKRTNFASPFGTPANSDTIDKAPQDTRLPAASHECAALPTPYQLPNQPYSPTPLLNPEFESPGQIQIVPPRIKRRKFTKQLLIRRLNELEMEVHQNRIIMTEIANTLTRLAEPDQPSRPIGFCR
jgi:hypothetical protein